MKKKKWMKVLKRRTDWNRAYLESGVGLQMAKHMNRLGWEFDDDLCLHMQRSPGFVYDMLHGSSENLTLDDIILAAAALGCEVNIVFQAMPEDWKREQTNNEKKAVWDDSTFGKYSGNSNKCI